MKAVVIQEQGGLEVMAYGDFPEPTIGPGEVLLRVGATALNRRDVFTREGSHGVKPPLPQLLGMEAAGEVAKVGPGVSRVKVGDRVLGQCSGGSYAEYARAQEIDLHPMPARMSFEEGAGITVAFSTAWHMLVCRAHLQPGEDLLVMAGGSGIGSAAIQVGRLLGARVLTTASTNDKLDKAKALGADEVINYREIPQWSQRVKELTDGKGVDLVFEHIGEPVWEQCYASMKRGGRFITSGVTAGHWVRLHLGQLWTRDLTLMGTSMQPRDDMATIMKFFRAGRLHGVVGPVFRLKDAAKAHETMEKSDFFGKIVLVP